MNQEEKNAIAEKALKSIKSAISAEKKVIKEYKEKYPYQSHRNPSVELSINLKHGWYGAKDEKYRLTMYDHYSGKDKHIVEVDTLYDLESIISIILGLLNKQTKVKGWSTLKIVRDKVKFGSGFSADYVEYPSKVTLCDPPCKEYTALQNYLNKYGVVKGNYNTTYPFKLDNYELFSVAMGGKRGVLRDEEGERNYLDHYAEECAQILANLRKFRGTKDIMYCERGNESYIDPVDRAYSERYEIECDGQKRSYLTITIQSPNGKKKYETKIF